MDIDPRSVHRRPNVELRRALLQLAFLVVVLVFGIAACSDDNSASSEAVDASGEVSADGSTDAGGDTASDADTTFCDRLDPSGDSDGDGLLDIIEDSNRNCIVDLDETDPFDADTDGDGVEDGAEDVDRNGVWNVSRGETNPRDKDSDGDGLDDKLELVSFACRNAGTRELLSQRATLEDGSTLFIPGGYQEITQISDFGVAVRSESETRSRFGVFIKGAPSLAVLHSLVDDFFLNTPNDLSVQWIGERAIQGQQWIGRVQAEAFRPLHPSYFLQLVVNAIVPDVDTTSQLASVWQLSEAEISFADVQIAWMAGEGDPGIAISMSTEQGDEEWFRRIHPRAIAPSPQSRLRIQCAEVPEQADSLSELLVVVPQRILAFGMAAESLQAVRSQLADGELDSVRFRVAPLSPGGRGTESQVRDLAEFDKFVESLYVDSSDGLGFSAVWTAAVSLAASDADSDPRVLLLVSDNESVEFMRAVEGSDDLVPLEQGSERASLVETLVSQLRATRAELLVAGPPARNGVTSCDPDDDSAVPTVGAESSFRSLVRAVGGTIGLRCESEEDSLFRGQLRELLAASPIAGVSREPIWGSGVLTNRDEETSGAKFNSRSNRTVVSAEEEISGADAGLSFTFWETPETP